MKRVLFLLFIFLFSINAFSQSAGIVVNSNNQPLANVDVFLVDQNIILKTNVDGRFYTDNYLANNAYINFF